MGIMICADRRRGYVKRKCLPLELTLVFFRFNCISLQLDNGTLHSFLVTIRFQEMTHCKAPMQLFCHDSATKTQRNKRVSLCSSSFSSLVQQQSNLIQLHLYTSAEGPYDHHTPIYAIHHSTVCCRQVIVVWSTHTLRESKGMNVM